MKKLVSDLELEESELNENSPLNLSSLQTLGLISFLDENFGVRVTAKELNGIDGIDKLISLIGKEKLE